MTATIAEVYDAAHMARVRAEYARTKADHALAEGCSRCTVGCDPAVADRWDRDPETGEMMCDTCAALVGRPRPNTGAPKAECIHGHKMTPENTYVHEGRFRCRRCRTDAAARSKARVKAERKAARG